MKNEVKLNIRLTKELLEAIKLIAKERKLTASSFVRQLVVDYIKLNDIDIDLDLDSIEAGGNKIKSNKLDLDQKAQYHEIAQRKRELKSYIDKTHNDYLQMRYPREGLYVTQHGIDLARKTWKQAIIDYKNFCNECKQNKNRLEENKEII